MRANQLFRFILMGLSVALSALSLFLILRVRTDFDRYHSATEDALREQLAQTTALLDEMRERQRQLELAVENANRDICRDYNVHSIAHRGVSAAAPENTLPAFRLAKEYGFSCVETDIHFTADGIPVCIHDSSIDRTSNGTGAVSDMTLEELKQYDFGSWKGEEYAGTTIPAFEEFLFLCKSLGLRPNIELTEGTPEQVKLLVDTVNRYGMRGNVSWISFHFHLLSAVRWYDDEARLGFLTGVYDAWTLDNVRELRSGKNEVFLSSSVCNDQIIEDCRQANVPFEFWPVNEEEQFATIDPYITGITSDSLRYGQYLYEQAISR